MTCMKCGAQTGENQVFCDHCLSVMEEYPIRRNIHIHLPKRQEEDEPVKKPVKKKRPPTPEEQISQLRMKVLRLRLVAVVLTFLLCITAAFFGLKLYNDYTTPKAGLNYTIDTSSNK